MDHRMNINHTSLVPNAKCKYELKLGVFISTVYVCLYEHRRRKRLYIDRNMSCANYSVSVKL